MPTFHSRRPAPVDLLFYSGKAFPRADRNGAFIVLQGTQRSGYNVVFVPFDRNGKLECQKYSSMDSLDSIRHRRIVHRRRTDRLGSPKGLMGRCTWATRRRVASGGSCMGTPHLQIFAVWTAQRSVDWTRRIRHALRRERSPAGFKIACV